jgi:predicted amidophosphoribosyltransferase
MSALTYCPDCRKNVSESASACPHCGRVNQPNELSDHALKDRQWRRTVVLILAAMLLLAIIARLLYVLFIG